MQSVIPRAAAGTSTVGRVRLLVLIESGLFDTFQHVNQCTDGCTRLIVSEKKLDCECVVNESCVDSRGRRNDVAHARWLIHAKFPEACAGGNLSFGANDVSMFECSSRTCIIRNVMINVDMLLIK